MKPLVSNILLISFLFLASWLKGQDTISNAALESNDIYKSFLFDDTEFLDVLFYKHRNNVQLNNLGPLGSSFYFPTVNSDNSSVFLYDKTEIDKLKKLERIKPFTNLTWINAGRREQLFSFNHIQRFGDKATLDFIYQRISSPGMYLNQEANLTNFIGNFNYKSLNGLYEFSAGINYQNLEQQQNGGLRDINHFEADTFDRRELYEVNLNSSFLKRRRRDYDFGHQINIINREDSVVKRKVFIRNSNSFSTKSSTFYDYKSDHSFYDTTYFDSTATFWVDSTYLNQFTNSSCLGLEMDNWEFSASYIYNKFRYNQYYGIDSIYSSNYLGADITYKKNDYSFDFSSKYGITGFNQNDLLSNFSFEYNSDKLLFNLNVDYSLVEPSLYYQKFSSNHFIWINDSLTKEQTTSISSEIELKSLRLKLFGNGRISSNLLYFDTLAIAVQHNSTESNYSFGIEKNYSWKNVHGRTALIYQLTSNEIVLPLPNVIARQVLYYENKIFKRRLKTRIGANLSYTSEFYGYEFMPSISQFYTQNQRKIGNYPFVDFFVSLHLKRAQIFFKWEHLNAGWSGLNYYSTPNIPSLDRSFKFGVSWNMFD